MERKRYFRLLRHGRRAPACIERGEEIASHGDTVAPQGSIAREHQGIARKGEQNIVARLRRAVRDTFKEVRVTRRSETVQAREIGKTGNHSPGTGRHGCAGLPDPGWFHARRRITSVPLVPPKPKELDSATSIFIGRGVFGT